MSEAAQRKEKQKWAIKKLELDNAGRLRGIYFIDPADPQFKETVQNVRRKLEVLMAAAMPCKIKGSNYEETHRIPDPRKTKDACTGEADESTRKRLDGTPHKDHEDHIASKGFNSLKHYYPVHKFIPMPESNENT